MMDEKTDRPKRIRKKETISDIVSEKAKEIDFMDSFGSIILKNGIILKVRKMFEIFHQNWFFYMSALASQNKEVIEKMFSEMNGGIVSNGEMTINLADVSAMIAVHEMMNNDGKKRRTTQSSIDDDNDALKQIEFE